MVPRAQCQADTCKTFWCPVPPPFLRQTTATTRPLCIYLQGQEVLHVRALGWRGQECWDLKKPSHCTSCSPGPPESYLGCCTSH